MKKLIFFLFLSCVLLYFASVYRTVEINRNVACIIVDKSLTEFDNSNLNLDVKFQKSLLRDDYLKLRISTNDLIIPDTTSHIGIVPFLKMNNSKVITYKEFEASKYIENEYTSNGKYYVMHLSYMNLENSNSSGKVINKGALFFTKNFKQFMLIIVDGTETKYIIPGTNLDEGVKYVKKYFIDAF